MVLLVSTENPQNHKLDNNFEIITITQDYGPCIKIFGHFTIVFPSKDRTFMIVTSSKNSNISTKAVIMKVSHSLNFNFSSVSTKNAQWRHHCHTAIRGKGGIINTVLNLKV